MEDALLIYFRFFCSAQQIIQAYMIKIRQNYQRFRRRNSLSGFIFRKQRLFDTRLHLNGNPRQFAYPRRLWDRMDGLYQYCF